MGVLGGYLYWKVVLEFWFGHPKCHFWYPPKRPKWVILGALGFLGGTENCTSGARIKILRPLFNTNTPLKPPFRHFRNHFGPRKSDFWPFLFILVIFPLKFPLKPKKITNMGRSWATEKTKCVWNQWSSGNNMGTCTIGNSEIFRIRITLPHSIVIGWLQVSKRIWKT